MIETPVTIATQPHDVVEKLLVVKGFSSLVGNRFIHVPKLATISCEPAELDLHGFHQLIIRGY
jgi:hypothetical protein